MSALPVDIIPEFAHCAAQTFGRELGPSARPVDIECLEQLKDPLHRLHGALDASAGSPGSARRVITGVAPRARLATPFQVRWPRQTAP